jgi:flagellar FliJ protein
VKKYRFRLDAVLRVRRIEQDRAAGHLAQSQRRAGEAAAAQVRAETAHVGSKGAEGMRATASFLSHRSLVEASALTVIAARRACEVANAEAEARRLEYVDAAGRVTGLENLDERQRGEYGVEELREEGLTVDDLVTARHGRDDTHSARSARGPAPAPVDPAGHPEAVRP